MRGGDAPLPCLSTLGTLHTLRTLEARCTALCRQSHVHSWLPATASLQQPAGLALAQPRAALAANPFGPAAGPVARLPPSLPAKGERWAPTQLACSAQRMRCADAAARAGTTWPACGGACGQRQRRPPCTPSESAVLTLSLWRQSFDMACTGSNAAFKLIGTCPSHEAGPVLRCCDLEEVWQCALGLAALAFGPCKGMLTWLLCLHALLQPSPMKKGVFEAGFALKPVAVTMASTAHC